MPDEEIDLEAFLEELVSCLDKRLKEHERAIRKLEKELSSLKSASRTPRVDSAVLRVLGGK